MTLTELIINPAFPRALVLGAFGGSGLALTAIYSRGGPLVYPVYAAFLAALALLLGRYAALPFGTRVAAGLAAFLFASAILYITVGVLAKGARRRLVAEGRLPATAVNARLSLWGHAWRLGFLTVVGSAVCSGVAFISG